MPSAASEHFLKTEDFKAALTRLFEETIMINDCQPSQRPRT